MRAPVLAAAALALAAVASPAAAAVITTTYMAQIPSDLTDFSTTVSLPRFNPNLGTLLSVGFTLSGTVVGDTGVENRNGTTPVTVTTTLRATLTLYRPDSSVIVVTTPQEVFVDNLARYDGAVDYAGTSGRTHTGADATQSESASTSAAADLALFTGLADILLPLEAAGTSSYAGASNIRFFADSSAYGTVSVTYAYEVAQAVPEPMALTLFGAGLVGLGLASRRRSRRRA